MSGYIPTRDIMKKSEAYTYAQNHTYDSMYATVTTVGARVLYR